MTDDGVTKLPVRFKSPKPEDRTLFVAHEVGQDNACTHSPLFGCSYVVDDKLAEVECGRCGAKLSPMWVLTALAHDDRRMAEGRKRYREEQARYEERSRTKCEHCRQMTRISRR